MDFVGGVRVSVRGLRRVRVMALVISKVMEIRSLSGGPSVLRF